MMVVGAGIGARDLSDLGAQSSSSERSGAEQTQNSAVQSRQVTPFVSILRSVQMRMQQQLLLSAASRGQGPSRQAATSNALMTLMTACYAMRSKAY